MSCTVVSIHVRCRGAILIKGQSLPSVSSPAWRHALRSEWPFIITIIITPKRACIQPTVNMQKLKVRLGQSLGPPGKLKRKGNDLKLKPTLLLLAPRQRLITPTHTSRSRDRSAHACGRRLVYLQHARVALTCPAWRCSRTSGAGVPRYRIDLTLHWQIGRHLSNSSSIIIIKRRFSPTGDEVLVRRCT